MAAIETNGSKNGAKPHWKRPKKEKKFTEEEMARIKVSRAAMKAIQIQIERGDFDEYLKREDSKQ